MEGGEKHGAGMVLPLRFLQPLQRPLLLLCSKPNLLAIESFISGTIGAVLNGETYASLNGRFMSDYGTTNIEYMFPYYFDKLCIISPKALKIPQWMAIFKCFSMSVWIAILLVNCCCGLFWFLLKKSQRRR